MHVEVKRKRRGLMWCIVEQSDDTGPGVTSGLEIIVNE